MMEVIDPRLTCVQVRRRDPFCGAVLAFSRAPSAVFDETIVRSACQRLVGDIRQPAIGPVQFGVMHLAAGDGVSGLGAATVPA